MDVTERYRYRCTAERASMGEGHESDVILRVFRDDPGGTCTLQFSDQWVSRAPGLDWAIGELDLPTNMPTLFLPEDAARALLASLQELFA